MSRKLKPTPRFTPHQLQSKLNELYQQHNYHPHILTSNDWYIINNSRIGYSYAPLLKNTTPYKQFVLAYFAALSDDNAPYPIKYSTYTIMSHAITEMRRIHQHNL